MLFLCSLLSALSALLLLFLFGICLASMWILCRSWLYCALFSYENRNARDTASITMASSIHPPTSLFQRC